MRPALCALLAILATAAPAGADRAIPYAQMHAMFARVAALQGGVYFEADARLISADPAVPTRDLDLSIRSRSGEIRVPVAADGSVQFPIRADLLAPDFEGLRITFGTAATATLETAGGPVRFKTDAEHRIRIPDRREWRREDPYVQLSTMPVEIALDVD